MEGSLAKLAHRIHSTHAGIAANTIPSRTADLQKRSGAYGAGTYFRYLFKHKSGYRREVMKALELNLVGSLRADANSALVQ